MRNQKWGQHGRINNARLAILSYLLMLAVEEKASISEEVQRGIHHQGRRTWKVHHCTHLAEALANLHRLVQQ